jgi:MFS family permease
VQAKRFWTYENAALVILSLAFSLVFFDRMSITFLLPYVVPELKLSNTQIGLMNSVLSLAWAASGFLLGSYADRYRKRKAVLVLTIIAFSLCTMLSGAVAGIASLLVVRAIMGFAEGPVLPITQSIMAQESSPQRRGFNMGVLQNGVSSLVGAILGPPLMVALAEAFGWRHALFVAGLPGLLIALLVWAFLRNPDRDARAHASTGHALAQAAQLGVRRLLGYRNVCVTIVGASALATATLVLMVFTPLYLVQQRGLSPQAMGGVMSAFGVAVLIGGLLVPALSDRFGRKPVMVLFCLLSVLAPLVVIHLRAPVPVLAAAAFITYLGVGCFPLLMATVPSETVPAGNLGRALGLIMGVAEVIGGVIAPTVAGMLGDALSPEAPFYLCAGGALMAAVACLGLIETAPAVLKRRGVVAGGRAAAAAATSG